MTKAMTERTEEVRCARCRHPRWILLRGDAPVPDAYTCQRCRAVLAARNAVDPLQPPATEARRAAAAKGRAARRQRRATTDVDPGSTAAPGVAATSRRDR